MAEFALGLFTGLVFGFILGLMGAYIVVARTMEKVCNEFKKIQEST